MNFKMSQFMVFIFRKISIMGPPLGFSIKTKQKLKNITHFLQKKKKKKKKRKKKKKKKKKKKLLGFRYWLEFKGICKNIHTRIFEIFYNFFRK